MGLNILTLGAAKKNTEKTADSLGSLKGAPCVVKSTTETEEGTIVVFEWTGNSGATETTSILIKNGENGQTQTISTSRTPDNDGAVITIINADGTTASTSTIYDGRGSSDSEDITMIKAIL